MRRFVVFSLTLWLSVPIGGSAATGMGTSSSVDRRLAPRTPRPAGAGAQLPGTDVPPPQRFRGVAINTPGQSGHVSLLELIDQTAGTGLFPDNPHLADQLGAYSSLRYKPGDFFAGGTPAIPRPGIRVYRDAFGVPSVYGDSLGDAWYGVGYALAQDRMWQMHLLRMVAHGRLGELVGTDGIGMDRQIRRDFYTPAEYAAFLEQLDPWELDILSSYAAGVNQYIAEMHLDPSKMPAEIAALALPVEPWTPLDTAALGTLVARSVASDGGQELENASLVRSLLAAHPAPDAKAIFDDLIWLNDPGAPTSVPPSEGTFTSYPHGAPSSDALDNSIAALPSSFTDEAERLAAERALRDRIRRTLGLPRPGSDMWVVDPSRSANGNTFLFNGPQVGYTVAGLLTELEVHGGSGATRMDARGITVAGVPVVGIGYTARHAWGLTSGLSDTIDMYAERLAGDSRHYTHNGVVREMECRTEVFKLRNTLAPDQTGIETREFCRTVHGPVVAIDEPAGVAYAQRYAIWGDEIGTLRGLWRFSLARSLGEFEDAMRMVTWNENTTYADVDGHIAYWHPGRYPARPRNFDERLPYPGTGEAEWERFLTYEEMPHSIDPAQGWLANWNSKPSAGWTSGDPHYSDRPWGQANRLDAIGSVLGSSAPIGAIPPAGVDGLVDGTQGIFAPDVNAGLHDTTVAYFRPLLAAARAETADVRLQRAIDLILAWDGNHQDGNGNGKVDHPGMTIFHEWVQPAAKSLFDPYISGHGGFSRGGGHPFEPSPVINMFLRALLGPSATLPQSRNYLGAETASQVILRTLGSRLDALESRFGTADMSAWLLDARRAELEVQGLGPGGSIPFQDRGSYIQVLELFTD